MDNQALISVIVPVYNVEKYLRQCIQSVLAQTYSAFELILIDDASTDGSADICREMAATDHRIIFLQNDRNQGQAFTRNRAIDLARGQSISFLDSDDLLLPDSLKLLSDVKSQTGVSLVCGKSINFTDKPPIVENKGDIRVKIIGREEALKRLLYQQGQPDASPWGKLFDKSLFKNERFRNGIIYEDLDLSYRILMKTDHTAICEANVYLYRQNPTGTLSRFNPKRLDVLDVTRRMVEFFDYRQHPNTRFARELLKGARDRRLSSAFNILGLIYSSHALMPETEKECKKIIKELRCDSLFNPEVRLKNKIGILSTYIGGFPLYRILSRIIYR